MSRPAREPACPFCAIVAGEAPASRVYEDARVVAFLDLRQAVPGHVLVVPRTHVARLHQLGDADAAALAIASVRIAGAIERAFAPAGMNLWQSNGEAGGQEVDHVHFHVHPRNVGDGLLDVYPRGLPASMPRVEMDALAERLRGALGS